MVMRMVWVVITTDCLVAFCFFGRGQDGKGLYTKKIAPLGDRRDVFCIQSLAIPPQVRSIRPLNIRSLRTSRGTQAERWENLLKKWRATIPNRSDPFFKKVLSSTGIIST
jgi:hypothetical protein